MDLPIAVHNIEVKIKTIKKHIQYAIDDLEADNPASEILDALLDRMDNGTNDNHPVVPDRLQGDLSLNEELKFIKGITLTKGNNYV